MKFIWPDSARAELRAIDRDIAVRILEALSRYGKTGEGNVRALPGVLQGFSRLRVGDHRVIFAATLDEIVVVRVRHRSDVYR
jgi:mRNA-degrading endonuclease RelE of RelBE toxin-antitoxin system